MRMDGCGRRFNETLAEVEGNLVREESAPPASVGPLAQLWPCQLCGRRASCHFRCSATLNLPSSLRRTRLSFFFFSSQHMVEMEKRLARPLFSKHNNDCDSVSPLHSAERSPGTQDGDRWPRRAVVQRGRHWGGAAKT